MEAWTAFADQLWGFRWWFVPLLAMLYAVPLIRILSAPVLLKHPSIVRINTFFGRWEHLIAFPRDTILALYLAGGAIWHAVIAILLMEIRHAWLAIGAILLLFVGEVQRRIRKTGYQRLISFVMAHPMLHPREFFDHFFCLAGAFRHLLPEKPSDIVDPTHLDFKSRKEKRFLPLHTVIYGLWSTFWITRLMALAKRQGPAAFTASAASALALLGASHISRLCCFEVRLEDVEKLSSAAAHTDIYAFNHMSALDFLFAPIVLAATSSAEGPSHAGNFLPRFLLAKDHFKDNPLYYNLLGIGRVAEALGMIFVDRSLDADPQRARAIALQASQKLLEEGVDLAIYPQGKRGLPCVSSHGERLDAAYYTVGSRERIKIEGAHLKKGTAYIATETALSLLQTETLRTVRLIPVALCGTGIALPRKRWRIKQNVLITLRIGEPIIITPAEIADIAPCEKERPQHPQEERYLEFVGRLHNRIDLALKTTAQVHANLERRFFEDIRTYDDTAAVEEVAIAMKAWRGDDYLVHAILDALYACPPKSWRALQGELMHLLRHFAPREELIAFKSKVADLLPM